MNDKAWQGFLSTINRNVFLECDKCVCCGRDYKKNYRDGSTVVSELLPMWVKLENPKYMRSNLGVFEDVDKDGEFVFLYWKN
jgi:hypothetical protein